MNLFTKLILSILLFVGLSQSLQGQPPTITTFTPANAKPGDAVTITGTNFNTTTTNNIVFFGATKAIINTATATSLSVTVPSGATYAPITLLNTGTNLAAYSFSNFNPIYSPAKTNITSTDFSTKVDFSTSSGPGIVAISDLDGDGRADIVILNSGSTLSIFRNTGSSGSFGSGSFAAKVDFTTGTNPNSLAIGDLDGDGKPDLAVANQGSNTVSVFRNTSTSGIISFAGKVDFTTGSFPYSVAIGDLDGDGKLDLAVANNTSATVSVYRNTATVGSITTGSFAAKVDFTASPNPQFIAIGDLDRDGKPDLAVANNGSSNSVSVFQNTATSGIINTGSFAAKVDFATGTSASAVVIGDLDGDGNPDLVVSRQNSNFISILRNTTSTGIINAGSFAAKVDFATGISPVPPTIGDLDGDGKPDLVIANANSNTVSVYRNTAISGTITTGSFAAKIDFTTGSFPTSSAIGDLDGDGKPDLSVTNAGANTFSILRNADPIAVPTITSFTPANAKPGDAVTISGTNFNTTPANNIVFFGATKATVSSSTATSVTVNIPSGATYGPITLLNTGTNLAAYSLSNFTPTYSPAKTGITATDFSPKVDFTTGNQAISLAIGDLDGDGKSDLVVVNRASNTVSVYRNTSISGSIVSGSFAAKQDFATGSTPVSVAIGDLDGDGKPDLAITNFNSNTVSVLRNTATSGAIDINSFAAKIDFTTGTNPQSVAIGDLDKDGKVDLVVANYSSNTVSVYRNTATSGSIGLGSFAAKVDFATGTQPYSVAIGDLDGDNKLDLVIVNSGTNTFSILRNTATLGNIGLGSFAANVDFTSGSSPYSVAIGDLDGDGKPDLAVANRGSNSISLYRNISSSGSIGLGSFAANVDFTAIGNTVSVAIGDLDGDGRPDLATTDFRFSNLSIFRNADIVFPPTITSATYNATTGSLVVTATNLIATAGVNNDIIVNKITLTGEGLSTYTLTSPNVDITSSTSFSITLNATDLAAINQIFNKNGLISTGSTTYNLAAAADWMAASTGNADLTGNGITVSNVAIPTITSATYNISTGTLVVTGTGLLKLSGTNNDIDVTKLSFTGQAGATFTLTSNTANVDITNGTGFTVNLGTTDKTAVNALLNKNGTSSVDGSTYNLAAVEDWNAGADAAVVIADLTGNSITVSNVATITTTGTLAALTTAYGTASSNTSFSVSGTSLTNDIIVTAPAGFELSVSTNSGFGNSVTLTQTGGIVVSTTVFVRLKANNTVALSPYSGNVVCSSTNASSVNVPTVSSTVTQTALTITGLTANNKVFDGTTAATLSGTPTLNGVVGSDNVVLGGTAVATFTSSAVGNNIAVTVTGYTISGTAASNYTLSQPTGLTANITSAVITLSGTLNSFSSCVNSASVSQSFTVSGANLVANVTLTAATGYELSTSANGIYINSIQLVPVSGTLASTTVFVRLNTNILGTAAGNIVASSTNATTQNLAVSGTVNALPIVSAITGGTSPVCVGSTINLNSATTGGIWSSSDVTLATVNTATGVVTGIAAGNPNIIYTVTNINGCSSNVSSAITVNPLPALTTITGPSSVCQGNTITQTNTASAGVWSSGNTTIATVNNSGIVTGVIAGVATINYIVTNANNCSVTNTKNVTVLSQPAITPIIKDTLICKATNLIVDATVSASATYAWAASAGGFTSILPKVTITNPALYRVTITLLNGCFYLDSINLRNTSDTAIRAKVLVSAQGFLNENVVAVNLTNPSPQSALWTIPNGASVVSQSASNLVLTFATTGKYQIGLKATSFNVCSSSDSGIVIISNKDTAVNGNNSNTIVIREVNVSPNPSTGIFNFAIKLNRSGKVSIRIYSISGLLAYSAVIPEATGITSITQQVNITSSQKDTYIAVVETADSHEVRTLIKN